MRCAILDAARIEFAAKGFAGASMRSIARSIGVKIAHIQHHFGDKQALWGKILSDVLGRQASEMNRICELNSDRPPDELIGLLIDSLVHYAADNPQFVALMSQARTSPSSEEAPAYRVELSQGILQLTELIARAQAQGRFVAGDPTILFYQLVGAALRIFTAAADATTFLGRSPTEPEVMTEHIRICLSVFMPGHPGQVEWRGGTRPAAREP